jgi:LPXTG-motif cell wall-anchored protein
MADLDGDDDLDIATADYYGDTVSILFNNGQGIFSKDSEYQTGEGPRSIFLSDVDGDDDIDLVTANYQGDSISVLKNNGAGSFAAKVDYDVGEGPYSIFLADIGEDANNDLDVVTADEQSFKVSVLVNDGNGVFSGSNTYKVGTKPKGVFLTDMDDDGYSDIATANWADDSVSVLINKGDGTFNKDVTYDTGSSPRAIFMTDLNVDDLPDIVTANQHSHDVSVLINAGDGTFSSKIDYPVGENPISVLIGDIDDDNDNDVLTTNLISDTISVLKNLGGGQLGERADYNAKNGPYDVLFGDVNADGENDIVTANNYGDSVSVFYSNFPPIINILEPDGASDMANNSYTITWEDSDYYEDATITLFWDDDSQGLDKTEIISGLSEDEDGIGGSYVWDISEMPEGEYWIYAKIDDGIFDPVHDHSPGALTINHTMIFNIQPTFQIIEPDGENDLADFEFSILWKDSDPDDDAEISLYYDDEDSGIAGKLIAEGLNEDAHGTSGVYTWNTSELPEGEYYLTGICDDGINDPVTSHSTHPVIVNHTLYVNGELPDNQTPLYNNPPLIQLIEPDGEGDYANSEYMITWIDVDSDNDAEISLYYDSDSSGYQGTMIISGLSENMHGNVGAYLWNTSGILEGNYFIYAYIDDGYDIFGDYSPGMITVDHSGHFNTTPKILLLTPEKGVVKAHESYLIQWIDNDPDDMASVSLYYDSDQGGCDGALIISDLNEDDDDNTFLWNTLDIPDGDYYLYGTIGDGLNNITYTYSQGKIRIDHSLDEDKDKDTGDLQSNSLLFLILAVVLILILLIFLLRKRKVPEGDKEHEDLEIDDEQPEPSEELDDEEIEEEPLEDLDNEKIDEDPSEDLGDEKIDEEPSDDLDDKEIEEKPSEDLDDEEIKEEQLPLSEDSKEE